MHNSDCHIICVILPVNCLDIFLPHIFTDWVRAPSSHCQNKRRKSHLFLDIGNDLASLEGRWSKENSVNSIESCFLVPRAFHSGCGPGTRTETPAPSRGITASHRYTYNFNSRFPFTRNAGVSRSKPCCGPPKNENWTFKWLGYGSKVILQTCLLTLLTDEDFHNFKKKIRDHVSCY